MPSSHRCSVAQMLRRVALAVGALTVLALPASASAAVLDTVKVDAASTSVTKGSVSLVKGHTYTLNVSGTFTEVAASGTGHRFDALFCVVGLGEAQSDCSDHPRAGDFRITTGDTTFKDIDQFGGPVQSYAADHGYSVRFTPPASGVLRAGTSRAYKPCASCAERASGTITVQVVGEPRSSAPSRSGGGTTKSSAGRAAAVKVSTHKPTCRKSLRAAAAASNPWCPFGVLGVLPAPGPNVAADVGSAPLPDSTHRLDLVADLQDPHGEGFFDEYVVTVVKAATPVAGQVDGCLIVGAASSPGPIAFTYPGKTLVACATLAQRLHGRRHSCHTVFVPGFATDSAPSGPNRTAMIREARRRMQAGLKASCSRPHGTQIGMGLTAPSGSSLNTALGLRAHSAAGAYVRSGVAPSNDARLVYGWGIASG